MLKDLKAICTNVYIQNATTIYLKCKIKEITFKNINYSPVINLSVENTKLCR